MNLFKSFDDLLVCFLKIYALPKYQNLFKSLLETTKAQKYCKSSLISILDSYYAFLIDNFHTIYQISFFIIIFLSLHIEDYHLLKLQNISFNLLTKLKSFTQRFNFVAKISNYGKIKSFILIKYANLNRYSPIYYVKYTYIH